MDYSRDYFSFHKDGKRVSGNAAMLLSYLYAGEIRKKW